MTVPNVGTYEGQFRKGLFHGPGIFKWVADSQSVLSGISYAGWWRKGVRCGPSFLPIPILTNKLDYRGEG